MPTPVLALPWASSWPRLRCPSTTMTNVPADSPSPSSSARLDSPAMWHKFPVPRCPTLVWLFLPLFSMDEPHTRGNISILSCIQDDDERCFWRSFFLFSLLSFDPVISPPLHPSIHNAVLGAQGPHDPRPHVVFTSTPHPFPLAPPPTTVPSSSSTKRSCISLARPARKVPPRRLRRRDYPPAIAPHSPLPCTPYEQAHHIQQYEHSNQPRSHSQIPEAKSSVHAHDASALRHTRASSLLWPRTRCRSPPLIAAPNRSRQYDPARTRPPPSPARTPVRPAFTSQLLHTLPPPSPSIPLDHLRRPSRNATTTPTPSPSCSPIPPVILPPPSAPRSAKLVTAECGKDGDKADASPCATLPVLRGLSPHLFGRKRGTPWECSIISLIHYHINLWYLRTQITSLLINLALSLGQFPI
ncbi:hypothetical protein B0H14DRAFT_3526395 [Mycena olivaceomarginata]|nr:hypothetical protein B0H14DRAFT_3526395 [Mycena olivaceomarginata]